MFKKFDRKKFFLINRLNVLVILLLILASFVPYVYSRYEADILGDAEIDVAIYLLDEQYEYVDIKLPELIPQDEGYVYNFSISNNDGTNITDTSLKYDLSIVTTTNLPLEYELYENNDLTTSVIMSDTIEADSDGTYFRTLKIPTRYFGYEENQTNTYTLVIYYRSDNLNYEYQGLVESIRIVIDSSQILEGD